MSDRLDFTGRVAIVTGAGRGLGREFALLLAARGAKVVVNDLGVQSNFDGSGSDASRAAGVAADITAAGGEAAAEASSVATVKGARAIVDCALEQFGRIDIVINNAGILGPEQPFVDTSPADFRRLLDVHLLGTAFVTQAAWPHLERQAYGRVVNITSGSLFGYGTEVAYSAAKAGQYGLTRALADAGRQIGVNVNAVMPYAYTEMAAHAMAQGDSPVSGGENEWLGDWMKRVAQPHLCAPLVCWLAHEQCPAAGELFSTGGGRIARAALVDTPGYVDPNATLEDVRDHFDEVLADDRYAVHAAGADRARYNHRLIEEALAAEGTGKS